MDASTTSLKGLRKLVLPAVGIGLIFAVLTFSPPTFLTGALLSPTDIAFLLKQRADTNGDSILTAREIRKELVKIVRDIALSRPEGDINGDGVTDRADVSATVNGFRELLQSICGNGTVNAGERCDDGNTANNDGCSSICAIESGYSCSGTPSTCSGICGDGQRKGNETCDDGNTTSSDGCSATCAIESGYTCTTAAPNVCTRIPVCGNGTKEGTEACDDSNTANNDGCSSICAIESGYSCSGTPSTCSSICGDGQRKGNETCDDGNTTSSDGCSSVCAKENNFRCTGAPSMCVSYLSYVLNLADTNRNGVVSENEALILTLDVADAANQPFNTVSQFDIDADGDVDNVDVAAILGQLDILAP